jgi:hypothetical protein
MALTGKTVWTAFPVLRVQLVPQALMAQTGQLASQVLMG